MQKLESTLSVFGHKTVIVDGRKVVKLATKYGGVQSLPAQSVEMALLVLSSVCNNASTIDGKGYSKGDAALGHKMADKVLKYGVLSAAQLAWMQQTPEHPNGAALIWSYRKQLEGFGFDIEQLLDQPAPAGDVAPALQAADKKVESMVTVPAILVHQTEKAFLLRVTDKQGKLRDFWSPRSMTQFQASKEPVTPSNPAWGTAVVPSWKLQQAAIDL